MLLANPFSRMVCMEYRCFKDGKINSTTISAVCKESKKNLKTHGNVIGECPIVIVETLAIWEAIRATIHLGMSNVVIKSDCWSRYSINSWSKSRHKQISNLIEDIRSLVKNIKNILSHRNRTSNVLADKIVKITHPWINLRSLYLIWFI